MRVLQLTPVFGSIGGMESYVARLSAELCAQGHTTTVAVDDLKPGAEQSYEVVSIPGLADVDAPCSREVEAAALRLAAAFAPDIVLVHGAAARIVMVLSACYPTVGFVHTFLCAGSKLFRRQDQICTHPVGPRCLLDWYAGPCGTSASLSTSLRSYRQARSSIAALRGVRAVVVASAFMRDYLGGEGIDIDRIHVLSDLDTGVSRQASETRQAGPAGNLLFVGRAVYNKGIQYLLRALPLLDERCRLTVVGDGWYMPELKALATELGLQERITFTGELTGEALESEYRRAQVAVVPSLVPEPAGLVVPEARAHGLPVVAFDVGGIGEWAEKYDSIYLAAPADVGALAQAIQDALAGKPAAGPSRANAPRKPMIAILQHLAKEAAADITPTMSRPAQTVSG